MPDFDRTGPFGRGSGTGRRLGSCYGALRENNRFGSRRWFGTGRGHGGGFRSGRGRMRGFGRIGNNAVIDYVDSPEVVRNVDETNDNPIGIESVVDELRTMNAKIMKLSSRLEKVEKK